jgi:hypothetical protein
MTAEELRAAWREKGKELSVKHKNMKTVQFWPVSYEEGVFHKFYGYWISLQTREPIVSETIKIKQEDLANWEIVNEN